MFVNDWRTLWRLTQGAKRIQIEFPVKAGGTRTASFDVAGLDRSKMPGWDEDGAKNSSPQVQAGAGGCGRVRTGAAGRRVHVSRSTAATFRRTPAPATRRGPAGHSRSSDSCIGTSRRWRSGSSGPSAAPGRRRAVYSRPAARPSRPRTHQAARAARKSPRRQANIVDVARLMAGTVSHPFGRAAPQDSAARKPADLADGLEQEEHAEAEPQRGETPGLPFAHVTVAAAAPTSRCSWSSPSSGPGCPPSIRERLVHLVPALLGPVDLGARRVPLVLRRVVVEADAADLLPAGIFSGSASS